MTGQFKYSEELRTKAVEMYAAGAKPEDIATEIGCSAASVYVWATNAHVREKVIKPPLTVVADKSEPSSHEPVKPAARTAPAAASDKSLPPRKKRELKILELWKQNLTQVQIRNRLHIGGGGTVRNVLLRNGIPAAEIDARTAETRNGNLPRAHVKPGPKPKPKPEQTNLALPLSRAEEMLASRARAATNLAIPEDVSALKRQVAVLRAERDSLRTLLDTFTGQ